MITNMYRATAIGRAALNLSQAELAEQIWVSKATIIKIENGNMAVKIKTLNLVFDFFREKNLDFVFNKDGATFKFKFDEDKNVRQH